MTRNATEYERLLGEAEPKEVAVDDERTLVSMGGAPPSPTLLKRMAELNMDVVHLYGLTETYGPITVCDWRPEWDALAVDEQARLKARRGVGNVISEQMRVVDDDGYDVPADGQTLGEVALRGNNRERAWAGREKRIH